MGLPETRYVKAQDGVSLAYQELGQGPPEVVWITGLTGGLEVMWEKHEVAEFFSRIASFSRLIRRDMRGTGLSDRGAALPDLETQATDLLTVLDAAGVSRPVIAGSGAGSALAALFTGTYPDRTQALILHLPWVRAISAPDWPWGDSEEEVEISVREAEEGWGTEEYATRALDWDITSFGHDPAWIQWYAKLLRHWVSPSAAAELIRRINETDVRAILPVIRVPTLAISRAGRPADQREAETQIAALIPGAQHLTLPGVDAMPWAGDTEPLLRAIETFLGVHRPPPDVDRVLASVLFTDIVQSTSKAAELGDAAWRNLVTVHHHRVREQLKRFDGHEIDTAGDGFFATFTGPARAVRCAQAIIDVLRDLGLEIRAGVHTGEVEALDDKVAGIAVSIGARIASMAGPSEVLVSQTVKDLVAGSGLRFEAAGEHELKGVPDSWHLYRVVG